MKRIPSWTPFTLLTRAALLACAGLALSIGMPHTSLAACVGGGTGNGVLEAGEECDDGAQGGNGTNGSTNSCCSTQCTLTKTPDLYVGDLTDTLVYRLGNMHAFAVGTTSCSAVGNDRCWVKWFSSIAEHPVIGQNMFRLKNGRFEQIGQAWLKHGFTALQQSICSSCTAAPSGSHLGVGCSDPYVASLNDDQNRMGPKSHVDASNGVYTYPDSAINTTGNDTFKRLQVHNEDLDPGLNGTFPATKYWVEGQYIAHDDALGKNNGNNASYRRVVVTGSAGSGVYNINLQDSTQRQHWALEAWKIDDPNVTLNTKVGDGFLVAARATPIAGGMYHYEYAVHNMYSARGVGMFSIPVPAGAVVTNIGFHDVDYHSGEPYDGTDWPGVYANGAGHLGDHAVCDQPQRERDPLGDALQFPLRLQPPPDQRDHHARLLRARGIEHDADHHRRSRHVQSRRRVRHRRDLRELRVRLLEPGRRHRDAAATVRARPARILAGAARTAALPPLTRGPAPTASTRTATT
jgi:hypothetical protein